MDNLINLPRQPDRWYREPWLLLVFGGPILVIMACAVTLYLAIVHPDPLVSKDYYREGVRINAHLAELKAAEGAAAATDAAQATVAHKAPAHPALPAASPAAGPTTGVAP
jgi:hypothetical protein